MIRHRESLRNTFTAGHIKQCVDEDLKPTVHVVARISSRLSCNSEALFVVVTIQNLMCFGVTHCLSKRVISIGTVNETCYDK